jgi:hypothetical protein
MEHKNIRSKQCLICKSKKGSNWSLYWHKNATSNEIWCYCAGKCQRGYSLIEYCYLTGLKPEDLENSKDMVFDNQVTNEEIQDIEFPSGFIPLSDPRSKPGIEYLNKRGLKVAPNLYYDLNREGIAFPYYLKNRFAGAQIRYLVPRTSEAGDNIKIITLTGTKTTHLFYNWNQDPLHINQKYIVVTEGAFNALSLQQALNSYYESPFKNPFKCIAASGSGASETQRSILRDMIKSGIKVIVAPDSDEAGIKMAKKYMDSGSCTHYAFVNEGEKDWNDKLVELGDRLAEFLISRTKQY